MSSAASSSSDKGPEPRDVDLALAGRGVWLVKVPKYLSERWKKSSGKHEVGKLKITKSTFPGTKPQVSFTMDDSLHKMVIPGQPSAPKEHKFILTGVGEQNLVVYSEQTPSTESPGPPEVCTGKLSVEGKVIQRAECRPVADNNYLRLKRLQMEASNKPEREVIQLSMPVQTYKPVSEHAFNDTKKSKSEAKRVRDDKEVVMNRLFAAFEKHQYYNINDLVRITNQPMTYVKEILKEIGTYNVKAPHKHMWELKTEYRHYKEPAATKT